MLIEQFRQHAAHLAVTRGVRVVLGFDAIVDRLAQHGVGLFLAQQIQHVPGAIRQHDPVHFGAVVHHVYEEESNWFLDLKNKTPPADQAKLTKRYQEHFARYMGDESDI